MIVVERKAEQTRSESIEALIEKGTESPSALDMANALVDLYAHAEQAYRAAAMAGYVPASSSSTTDLSS